MTTTIREWEELEAKHADEAVALFGRLGVAAQVERGAHGVSQVILSANGAEVRFAIGPYMSAIGMYRRAPKRVKDWRLTGKIRGLPVDERFAEHAAAAERKRDLEEAGAPGDSLELREEEREVSL